MSSLRSDTLTMRVTGVRITVFCSAIVIDVIVHCHTAGALFESNGRKQLSLSSCGWVFDPFRPVHNHKFPEALGVGWVRLVRPADEGAHLAHFFLN